MPTRTSRLHIRVDNQTKAQAADALAGIGLTLSDAARILPTSVVAEGGLPAGLTMDREAYDSRFRAKVREALDDPRAPVPHGQVMEEAQALIDGKRHART